MPSIFVKDDLRASVEAATGGKVTVLYTASGQPSYMNVIPKFNLEDIDASLGAGVHPAFIVGGVEKSELFIGTYQGIAKNGEFLSLPGVNPTVSKNFDYFVNTARANGTGWHCISNVEFAALALWCWKNGFQPRGNTNYGRSSDAPWETGRLANGGMPGDTTQTSATTLTGSGPASWRHDNTPGGIADLCGNIYEWSTGMRTVCGEIQIIANNDAAINPTNLDATSTVWKAIDGDTGALINPTFTGSISGEDYVPTTPKSVRYGVSGTDDYTLMSQDGKTFDAMTNAGGKPVSGAALAVLKRHGLYPIASSGLGGDAIFISTDGERMPYRGGGWSGAAGCGVFSLRMNSTRSGSANDRGSRPAFVL